jgi:hypothetical protein
MKTSILNIESLNNGSIKDLLAQAEGDILRIVLGEQYISYCYTVDGEKLDLRSWGMNIWFA